MVRRDRPHLGRRPGEPVRRQRLRDAHLAVPDVIGRLGVTIRRSRTPSRSRTNWTPAGQIGGAPGQGDKVPSDTRHRPHQGRLLNEEEVRQHHHPDQSQWLRGSPEADVARLELGTMPYNAAGWCMMARRAAVIAVFQIPAPMHSRSPAPDQDRDVEPVEALPARHGYLISLDNDDAAGVGRHQRDRSTRCLESCRPRHPGRVRLPAELARDPHSVDDGYRYRWSARSAFFLASRLLDQRALATRPRPRYRHRRRRCDPWWWRR